MRVGRVKVGCEGVEDGKVWRMRVGKCEGGECKGGV